MSSRWRALDVSPGIAGGYAAKLLAEAGWDVVKYEPPAGDVLRYQESRWGGGRGGAFSFINQGKRGLSTNDGSLLGELASRAHVVIGDFSTHGKRSSEIPADAYQKWSPMHATVSISPFGMEGPRADWVASELIIEAASCILYLTGEWDQSPMQLPPYQTSMSAGVVGASATLAAARSARINGQPLKLDLAIMEALASQTYAAVSAYVYNGQVLRREQRVKEGFRMVPAANGFIYCAPGALTSMRMDGIAVLLNEPRLAEERFQTAEGRMQNWDEFVALFVPPFRSKTAEEWFEAAGALHMTFALVQTIDDLFNCPQLNARGFLSFQSATNGEAIEMPGSPYRIEDRPPIRLRPAPASPGIDSEEVVTTWLKMK